MKRITSDLSGCDEAETNRNWELTQARFLMDALVRQHFPTRVFQKTGKVGHSGSVERPRTCSVAIRDEAGRRTDAGFFYDGARQRRLRRRAQDSFRTVANRSSGDQHENPAAGEEKPERGALEHQNAAA